MDMYEAFLAGKPVPRMEISGGSSSRRIVTEYETTKYKEDVVPRRTTEYAQPFVDKLKEAVWRRFDVDVPTEKPDQSDVYRKYDFDFKMRAPRLPIEDYREEILEKVRKHTVVILRGPTGCGKTTKVPQFILDDYRERGLFCNIVVAQPRRIAASSNAKRVCRERNWELGSIVGYKVGSDRGKNRSADTKILFCTTGVLVETIIHDGAYNPLDQYTHIILDEVHERDKDMDFLMIAIYKYLNPKIRVILMSATIDVDKFAKYYEVPGDFTHGRAPIIELGYRSNFHVEKIFLDQIEPMMYDERIDVPEISDQMYQVALKLVAFFERIDRKHAIAEGIDVKTYESQPKPSVLIFLPGIFEIKQMYQRLEEWCTINEETKILRIIMHSSADPLINELAMRESDRNTRKIILATNIAESSITVPNVKYVIDFCLARNLVVNPVTKFPTLQLAWASRDNCEQRAGRSGRVMNGWCFRLVSRHFYNKCMRQSAKAELVTSPLENIILKTKQLNLGSPEEVLALALDKPYLDEIHNAVLRLKEMGAMLTTVGGRVKDRDGDITYIGEIMSSLPIEVKLSKMIALGYCFGVMEECIIIAAALNCSKNFFVSNKVKGVQVYSKILEFANGSGSDLFALLYAYRTWKRLRDEGKFGNIKLPSEQKAVRLAEKKWADENFLEIAALRECDECVKELKSRIKRMNLIDCTKMNLKWNSNEKYIVLKVVIAGAFYPNYYSRGTKCKRNAESATFKALGGRDSSDTVFFTGFRPGDFPHIYIKRIQEILIKNNVISERDAHLVNISSDGVAEKVYVSFKKTGKEGDIQKYGVACQPGIVLTEVFKAIKLKLMRVTHNIDILCDRNTALSFASEQGLLYKSDDRVQMKSEEDYLNVCYPKKLDKEVIGFISHTENCGRFWLQPKHCLTIINDIYEELNSQNSCLEPFRAESEVKVGSIVAAEYPSGRQTEYYRAKVLHIDRKTETKQTIFEVRFIDFGNTRKCDLSVLRRLRGVASRYLSLPPYCFPCALAFIQPSHVNSPDGVWRNEHNKLFVEETDGAELRAEIFSVVNGIVRVLLYKGNTNLNSFLTDKRIASHCEESYMSKHDNIEREIAQKEEHAPRNHLTQGVIRHLQEEDIPVIDPPTSYDGRMRSIPIKGPYSPLEIELYGLCNNSSGCPKIDPLSVNHVLLENEPNDMSEKYLVAVNATSNDEQSDVTVRYTILMPNIRLFSPLMAAIFAPKMKLQRNSSGTNYVKMMTGLGCDMNGVCLSSYTNMKFDLDVELKNIDIETINAIRKAINLLMSRKGFEELSSDEVIETIRQLQDDLISLLAVKRLLIPEEYGDVSWAPYDKNDIAVPQKPRNSVRHVLSPHEYLKLKILDLHKLLELKNHHEDLKKKQYSTNDDPTARSPKYRICKVDIVEGIRLHLMSRIHKDSYASILTAIRTHDSNSRL